MHDRITFADIKAELILRIGQLCRELLPDGRQSGNYWLCSSPGQKNKTPNMWVRLDSGAWRDEPVAQGDIIKLVKYVENLTDNRAVYDWCLDWLGWRPVADPARLASRRRKAQEVKRAVDEGAAIETDQNRRSAMASFLNAEKDWRGSVLETYLRQARGIDTPALARLPGSLRLVPSARHIGYDGRKTSGWPMMIAAIYHFDAGFVAVHRTWLARDGMGKAPVKPQKKIWPAGWGGGVIRLTKGKPVLSPEQAAQRKIAGPVIIAEGIETGLSLACKAPDMRVWAAATLGNMEKIPDHPCVSGWMLAHDHLKDSLTRKQRQSHLDKLARIKRHFQATGKPVTEIWPEKGADFNDQLRLD